VEDDQPCGRRTPVVGVGFFAAGLRAWAVPWLVLAAVEWFDLLPLSVLIAYIEYKRNPKYREQYDLGLSPDGLSFRTSTVSSVLKWSLYSSFWETNRAFVLSYGRGIPTVIPKAAFATPADLDAARTILQAAVVAPR
jgi:YcxB-like protein